MSRVKGSDFDRLVTYLNTFKEGELIFRKDILKHIYCDPRRGLSTTDKWRRQLTICEYLEDTGRPGVYRRTGKYIPDWLASSDMETLARLYSLSWYKKHDPSRIAYEASIIREYEDCRLTGEELKAKWNTEYVDLAIERMVDEGYTLVEVSWTGGYRASGDRVYHFVK